MLSIDTNILLHAINEDSPSHKAAYAWLTSMQRQEDVSISEFILAELYGLLRTAPWQPTIVSVGHRSTLRSFHDQVLDVAAFSPPSEHVLYLPNLFPEPRPTFVAPPLPRTS